MYQLIKKYRLREAEGESSTFIASQSTELPTKVRRMIRIKLKSPWDDYSYIRPLNHAYLARNNSCFKLVNIQELSNFNRTQQLPILSWVQHSNIAAIYDIYSYDNKVFPIIELLEISFAELEVQKYKLEEWEIATIIMEVIKGTLYLSSLKISCKSLSQKNIHLSLGGEIKLVLDIQDLEYSEVYETPKNSQALLDYPILAEVMEDMMLPRYHLTTIDEGWSEDMLDFLTYTLSESLESVANASNPES